jgi:GNAT superfamily N-acetyltransferase
MPDMLVRLYDLPPLASALEQQLAQGISIRRVIPPEKHVVVGFVRRAFSEFWVSEVEVAFAHQPPTCFVAIEAQRVIGFAVYDTTAKGFFGPTGVDEAARGRGTGTALLLASLYALYDAGYAYAIIGRPGPLDYYAKTVGAIPIPGADEGIYKGLLRPENQ